MLLFSDTGCITLGWLANTKRAVEFQRWAKATLAAQISGEKIALSFDEVNILVDCAKPGEAGREARAFANQVFSRLKPGFAVPAAPAVIGKTRITRRIERLVCERFVAGRTRKEIGRELGISEPSVSLLLHAKYRFPAGAGEPECTPELVAAVAMRHLEVERERCAAAEERLVQKFLAGANNRLLENALDAVGRNLLRLPAAPAEGGAQ